MRGIRFTAWSDKNGHISSQPAGFLNQLRFLFWQILGLSSTQSLFAKPMISQTPVQSVLDDPKWSSGVVASKRSDVAVRLQTFPGVVGGEFDAQLVGLLPQHMGHAEVTISSTGFDSDNYRSTREIRSSNADISFLEVEALQIDGPALRIQFLIPYEAKGTDEGYDWHLQIHFADGTTEVFEVPVCRTFESNPEVSELEIAAAGLNKKEQWHADRSEERLGHGRQKSFEVVKKGDKLLITIPSRTPGRPGLAKGLGVFWGLWVAATCFFYLIADGDIEPMVILGIPLIAMSILLAFLVFGKSRIKFCSDQMEQRHSLFGLSIPKQVKRTDIAGFNTKCLGSLGDTGGSYLVVVEKLDSTFVFLSAALFNKNDSHTLVKRLNQFWELKRNY
jgi:hypothetical protein